MQKDHWKPLLVWSKVIPNGNTFFLCKIVSTFIFWRSPRQILCKDMSKLPFFEVMSDFTDLNWFWAGDRGKTVNFFLTYIRFSLLRSRMILLGCISLCNMRFGNQIHHWEIVTWRRYSREVSEIPNTKGTCS